MAKSEGIAPTTEPRHRPVDNFEPEDCCVMCHTTPGRRCKRCRSTYYCSQVCQRSDYRSHQHLCRQLATAPSRPSPEHKRAIFFPVDTDQPRLIWIPCRRQYDDDDLGPWTKVDHHPYLGPDQPPKGTMRIEHNPVRSRNLGSGFAAWAPYKQGHCISVLHRDAYLRDGSPTNRSISASVRASCTSTPAHEYRGPMIALREIHHEDYDDITLADFRHLMDYLVSYRNTHIRESVPDLHHGANTTVRGVKICCYGEVKLHGSEAFVGVDVTRANRIALGEGSISPISVCLGMPIRFWKDRDGEFYRDPAGWEENMTADSNPNVASMMVETDPSSESWGWASLYWNSEIGNVWAVREDGRDLSVDDVAMMCCFARRKMQRMFEDVMESGSRLEDRRRIVELITWENMVAYWEEAGGDTRERYKRGRAPYRQGGTATL
ncbi:hypothetical protein PHISCL_10121 [Aspergillus sclerotialis]|uniref:MYND-type domain-containing protein n=1 Tax=Aspergillus sclerotialis TaxID=2070753 RepID=A0A3A2ZK49_9EURO|nr:hypothetical protein PHISCL_10121 [Aspergillus sclerotialis]